MKIENLIPKGKNNAISRMELLNRCILHGLANNDRSMRRLIEESRKENVILNLSNGKGYFIPDKEDLSDLRHYIAQEKCRSISINRNLKMASNLLADMECGRI